MHDKAGSILSKEQIWPRRFGLSVAGDDFWIRHLGGVFVGDSSKY